MSPTLGATAPRSTPVNCRMKNDSDDSTDNDTRVPIKVPAPDPLEQVKLGDSDSDKQCLLLSAELHPFYERRSEDSNDECVVPKLLLPKEVCKG